MDLVSANIGVVEQSLFSRILTKIGIAILAIALFDLLFVNWWILKKSKVSKDEANPASQVVNKADSDTIREITSTPSPTPSTSPTSSSKSTTQSSPIVKTETVIEKQTQTIVQTAQKEIFVPLGQGSTNSSSFADLLVEPWPSGTKISFWAVWTMVCVCFSITVSVLTIGEDWVVDFEELVGEVEGVGDGVEVISLIVSESALLTT